MKAFDAVLGLACVVCALNRDVLRSTLNVEYSLKRYANNLNHDLPPRVPHS
jgi:hypothetical protein